MEEESSQKKAPRGKEACKHQIHQFWNKVRLMLNTLPSFVRSDACYSIRKEKKMSSKRFKFLMTLEACQPSRREHILLFCQIILSFLKRQDIRDFNRDVVEPLIPWLEDLMFSLLPTQIPTMPLEDLMFSLLPTQIPTMSDLAHNFIFFGSEPGIKIEVKQEENNEESMKKEIKDLKQEIKEYQEYV